MAKDAPLDVVFRVFPEGDVIALFPSERERNLIMSYQHHGQHSLASPELVQELRPAAPSQYANLLTELKNLGYRLQVKRNSAARRSTLRHASVKQGDPISDDARVREAIARFPSTFGLRGFPGDVFRISPMSSYVSEGRVMLYTQRKNGPRWSDFSKGTEPELRNEVVRLPSARASQHAMRKKSSRRRPRNHAAINMNHPRFAVEIDPAEFQGHNELPTNARWRDDLGALAEQELSSGRTYRRPRDARYTVIEWTGYRGALGRLLDWLEGAAGITRYAELFA